MDTNQSAEPGQPLPPALACRHAPGEGSIETCGYLRAVHRMRAWTERAEAAHRAGDGHRLLQGELSVLYGEICAAQDACPDYAALVTTREVLLRH
jgi:hypothetical protein